jgi:hypothetical protein
LTKPRRSPSSAATRRLFLRDHAGQPVDTAAGNEADPRLRQREHRILGGDNDVAGERGFEPAAHRDAIDRGDQRFIEVEARGKPGKACPGPGTSPPSRLHLQIVAGGKGALAGAGDNADPQVWVGGKLVPHAVQFPMRLAVQRVHHLGPVDRDDPHPSFILDGAEAVIGHGLTSSRRSATLSDRAGRGNARNRLRSSCR